MNRLMILAVTFALLFSFCFVQLKKAERLFELEFIKTERPFSSGEIGAIQARRSHDLSFIKRKAVTLERDNRQVSKIACLTNENYAELMGLNIVEGRFFSPEDCELAENICVLEKKTAALWFEGGAAAGEKLEIDGETFVIAGVAENMSLLSLLSGEEMPSLYLPFTSACRSFGETDVDYFLAAKDSAGSVSFGREEKELERFGFVRFFMESFLR